ncbi:MAG: hypothetical protein ACRDTF_20025, partial [Pseudonocardiaceae bacterium]
VLAVLLVLSSSCTEAGESASGPPVPMPVAELSAVPAGPSVVDTGRAPLKEEHAEVVRSVYQALAAGDLDALSALYAGDDWAGQAELLADPAVRRGVLDALSTPPANLGEGYLYPGHYPGLLPGSPVNDSAGYETAFFLDYDPPRTGDGPLRWRGIALPPT